MCRIGTKPVIVPKDNTKVLPKVDFKPEELKTEPELKNNGHVDSKHVLNIDPKTQKLGNASIQHKLVDDHHDAGHERGVLYKAKEESVLKACEKTGVKSSEKLMEKVISKTAIKAGEQVAGEVALSAAHTIVHGTKPASKFVKKSAEVLAKIEKNAVGRTVTKTFAKIGHTAEHAVGKSIDKIAGKGLDKAATALATKVGVKAASRFAAMVPVAGVAVGAYITKHDYDDYQAKMKDPTVTKTSRVLAGATVGLDALATSASALAAATVSTGVGLPVAAVAEGVSWVATGASIVTSGFSEYYKHK